MEMNAYVRRVSDLSYVKSSVYNKTEQALIKVSGLAAGLLPL